MFTGTLRCSRAGVWGRCPGSALLESQQPKPPDSQDAAEGTAAHWFAEKRLTYLSRGEKFSTSSFLNAKAPNGVIITQEMIDAVQVYVDDIFKNFNTDLILFIEKSFDISVVHPNNKGTLDCCCWVVDDEFSHLIIWDLKYGYGLVSPYDNWPMLNYAAGVLDFLTKNGQQIPRTIELRIVQPRAFHPDGVARSCTVSVDEMYDKHIPRLIESAKLATSAAPPLVPGPEQCLNCRARHVCPALPERVLQCYDALTVAVPAELDGEALGREVTLLNDMEKLLKARKSGIDAQALEKIKQGESVTGWTAASASSRRVWKGSDEEVVQLGNMMGVDLLETKIKSPAQAEKAGLAKSVVDSYVINKPGSLKLVPINSKLAKQVFEK